jgi:hypothetical protein
VGHHFKKELVAKEHIHEYVPLPVVTNTHVLRDKPLV